MDSVRVALVALLSTALAGVGCSERASRPAPTEATSTPVPVVRPPDRWLGQWNGPEGTFLRLAGGSGSYELTVQNLDGARKFAGTAAGSSIEFERDGIKEVIRATDGTQTGMKWLAGKSNCLTIRAGEGYCRD